MLRSLHYIFVFLVVLFVGCGDSSSGGDAIVAINTTNPTNAPGGNGTNPTNANGSTGGNGTSPTNANGSTGGNGSGSGNGTNTTNGSFI